MLVAPALRVLAANQLAQVLIASLRQVDVELARRIHSLLSHQGYTVRGVQQLLKGKEPLPEPAPQDENLIDALKRIRAELTAALAD